MYNICIYFDAGDAPFSHTNWIYICVFLNTFSGHKNIHHPNFVASSSRACINSARNEVLVLGVRVRPKIERTNKLAKSFIEVTYRVVWIHNYAIQIFQYAVKSMNHEYVLSVNDISINNCVLAVLRSRSISKSAVNYSTLIITSKRTSLQHKYA